MVVIPSAAVLPAFHSKWPVFRRRADTLITVWRIFKDLSTAQKRIELEWFRMTEPQYGYIDIDENLKTESISCVIKQK